MKSVGLLVVGTLTFWVVVALPARWLWGDSALLFSGTAALLCLAPTATTLVWCQKAYRASPEGQLLAVMGGTVVRMVVVVGVGMALFHLVEAFAYQRFWLWLIVFYLFTLTLEVFLITRQAAQQPQGH